MARIARVVGVGLPHHVMQRGNRRQEVFFDKEDREEYLRLLSEEAERFGLKIWAYCLMDNHVHLIVVPGNEESFKGIAKTHERYTRMINFKKGWRGYLWQGRFKSCVMDEQYLFAAVRYVERNPVRAKIVGKAWEYEWSSAQGHVEGIDDGLVKRFYLQEEIKDWKKYLQEEDQQVELIRKYVRTGRPLGAEEFIEGLERQLGRVLRKQKPGPKRNN